MSAINLGGGGTKKILDQVHKHQNMHVLEELNESNNNLTYKGKEIITNDSNSTILATQVIETEDRKFLSSKEKSSLSGVKGNIQSQIDILKIISEESMKFKGRFNSYSDMIKSNIDPKDGHTVFIDNDETQSDCKTIYVYQDKKWIRVRKDEKSGNGWIASNTAPTDKSLLWLDTSGIEPKIKWFNGSTWIDVSGLTTVPASKVIQENELKFVNSNSDKILGKMTEVENNLFYDGKPLGGGSSSSVLIKDDKIEIDSTYSSFKINNELLNKQNKLGFTPEDKSKKGEPNGYVPLESNSKISKNYLLEYSFIRNTIEERDLIENVEPGNTCYIESSTELYIYVSANIWLLIAKGNSIFHGKNNYDAIRNPIPDDDITHGFKRGSIWINSFTDKAYICTKESENNAVWELMAGSIVLNIGEIVPFKLDPLGFTIIDEKNYYEIPNINIDTDYIELTLNGHELIDTVHYEIVMFEDKSYIVITEELKSTDYLFGEIYKQDLNKAEQQMLKSVYDSNNNGKVDLADISDKTKSLNSWDSNTKYSKNESILINTSIYICKETHVSGSTIDMTKWKLLIAEPNDLSKFTTNDITPTNSRTYVTKEQFDDIGTIKSISVKANNNEKNITKNTREIIDLKNNAISLTNRVDNFKFTQLKDTPNSLSALSYLKVNADGSAITVDKDPLFAVKRIIDSKGIAYNKIDSPKFLNMQMVKQSSNGIFEFKLDANTFDILDMPKSYEHGKVLVADENNNKYVLADKESLTMSVENFSKDILVSDWTELDGKYTANVFHDMGSESLVISFTDEFKIEDKTITYEILNKSNIKIISSEAKAIKCVINCALGAGNGYWQYLMDWSKIDFVDDTRIRNDRAYSSSKFEEVIKSYALKNDYYTKKVSDARFGKLELEHSHENKLLLDNFYDSKGDLFYNNKKVLTELNPITYSNELDSNSNEFVEILDVNSLYKENFLQAILSSEILIKNNSGNEDATVKIRDNNLDLINIILKPNEIQKYHLGISNKIKVIIKGSVKTILTVSAL